MTEETLFLDNKSTLVLEDLSESGFSPVYSKDGLKREELRSALREMAMVHSVSWAYQHVTGEDLGKKYNLCEDIEELVNGFAVSNILNFIRLIMATGDTDSRITSSLFVNVK